MNYQFDLFCFCPIKSIILVWAFRLFILSFQDFNIFSAQSSILLFKWSKECLLMSNFDFAPNFAKIFSLSNSELYFNWKLIKLILIYFKCKMQEK